ncbi:MAG: SPW repeat protein [Pseudomonadota bacterium]
MAIHFPVRRWQDEVILLLGLWLIIVPMVLGYPTNAPITINAYICGALIAAIAAFDLYKSYAIAVIINLLVGLWVSVSPWVTALADRGPMMGTCVIIGVAVMALGMWELRSDPELHRQWIGGKPG